MNKTICGLDCSQCSFSANCAGCAATNGSPFGGKCVLASCCAGNGRAACAECGAEDCGTKKALIDEFNALGIDGMPRVTELYALSAVIVNLEYPLPGGLRAKFWDDRDVLLGNQLPQGDSGRFFGVVTDGEYLMVSEYGENGADPEIILFRKRKAE